MRKLKAIDGKSLIIGALLASTIFLGMGAVGENDFKQERFARMLARLEAATKEPTKLDEAADKLSKAAGELSKAADGNAEKISLATDKLSKAGMGGAEPWDDKQHWDFKVMGSVLYSPDLLDGKQFNETIGWELFAIQSDNLIFRKRVDVKK